MAMQIPLDQIRFAAQHAGLDAALVGAIVMKESSGIATATRFEPAYGYLVTPLAWAVRVGVPEEEETRAQKTSWGLMQCMGAVARGFGYDRALPNLQFNSAVGLKFGCFRLAQCLSVHHNLNDAIASYNAGSPRRNADGTYVNQAYVDAVLANIQTMKAFT